MRRRTLDLTDQKQILRFYTVEKLGDKRSLTPEGFLLCEDVPIARTGVMIYGPNEVPIQTGSDGRVRVSRDEDEVFRPEYIASYVGKPVVDDHPDYDVNPSNWQQLAVGVVLNPRRGTGIQSDLLIADFLITTQAAIDAVMSGKKEVSCGYDADYEETAPGQGRQTNMIGNHVALVEAGRCGPRCSIGDHNGNFKLYGDDMKTRDKAGDTPSRRVKLIQSVRDALEELEKKTDDDEGGEGAVHIHLPGTGDAENKGTMDAETKAEFQGIKDAMKSIGDRLDALEGKSKDAEAEEEAEKKAEAEQKAKDDAEEKEKAAKDDEAGKALEEEAPEGKAKDARMAKDSVFLEDSYQSTVAAAEILVPGIRIPTFDRKSDPKKTLDAICSLRRNALDLAYATADGRGIIEDIHSGKLELSKMKCADVRTLFKAASAMKRKANNTNDRGQQVGNSQQVKSTVRTLADINKLNSERYRIQ